MDIIERKIVAGLNNAEIETVKSAGSVIGLIKKAFEAEEITELDEPTRQLLEAVKQVIETVLEK